MDKLKQIIGTVAPVIGSVLGGPLGGAATLAITKALGLADDATEQQMMQACMNPDNLLKLKQAELEFAAKMKQLDIDMEKIAMQDRASARSMAVKTGGITVQVCMLVAFSLIFCYALFEIYRGALLALDDFSKSLINYALGTIGGLLVTVATFFVGTTVNSSKKDSTIYKLAGE